MSKAMRPPLFTFDGAWSGAYYELSLELSASSEEYVLDVLTALWQHPDLEGCYLYREQEPWEQRRMGPLYFEEDFCSCLHGIARMPSGTRIACASYVRQEQNNTFGLDLCLPMGSLAKTYPRRVANDFAGPWRIEVEDWLAHIGLRIAEAVPFRLGLIGYDVAVLVDAAHVAQVGVPSERYSGYLWPVDGVMTYHPRTW